MDKGSRARPIHYDGQARRPRLTVNQASYCDRRRMVVDVCNGGVPARREQRHVESLCSPEAIGLASRRRTVFQPLLHADPAPLRSLLLSRAPRPRCWLLPSTPIPSTPTQATGCRSWSSRTRRCPLARRAPPVWEAVCRVLAAALRRAGIQVLIYVDDFLLALRSKEEAYRARILIEAAFTSSGITRGDR